MVIYELGKKIRILNFQNKLIDDLRRRLIPTPVVNTKLNDYLTPVKTSLSKINNLKLSASQV